MKPVVGVFQARSDAEQAAGQLRLLGLGDGKVNVVTTQMTEKDLAAIPTNQGEEPGMIKAPGAVTGGALGLGLGDMVASLLVPGVGTVLGIGLAAGAFLGALGGGAGCHRAFGDSG